MICKIQECKKMNKSFFLWSNKIYYLNTIQLTDDKFELTSSNNIFLCCTMLNFAELMALLYEKIF